MATSHGEFYRGLERAAAACAAAGPAPAEQAAAVHRAMAPLLADTEVGDRLACRAGCSHCCHFPVGITFAEALLLAQAVAAEPRLVALVAAEAAATADRGWLQLVGRPCPLLLADRCAAHGARPLPCRALGSTDAEACAAALRGPATVPRDEAAWWRGLGAAAALAEAGNLGETAAGSRELRAALAAVLAAPTTTAAAAAFRSARPVP
jgi:hypothetical protein